MLWYLKTVYRNLFYYYKTRNERGVKFQGIVSRINNGSDLLAMRRDVTDLMLYEVGLRVVDDEADTIPWYVPISRVQKGWRDIVADQGYLVGLVKDTP